MRIEDFFKEFSVSDSETIDSVLGYYKNLLDAISRSSGQSFYVIDYHKKGFAYVSSNPLFLCGRPVEEVLRKGYYFYEEIMSEEDLDMLLEINQKGFGMYHSMPVEKRINMVISYDFHLIQPNRKRLMVNHKLTPILLTDSGEIWLALCIVSLSTNDKPGNVFIRINGGLHHFRYSFAGKRWHNEEIVSLSEREREVLLLSAEGYANDKIGDKLFIDVNTVKFHKRKLFEKFNVSNIAEAITFARNNWLL
ncbi:helix-turn-helix transcriptional regulator [Bacteroides sp. 519]|uniref:helix-turn-helix domain-containing protein n=1 Tax=Bacteroides sp. 519 TaxID=2302937 RepID=UPI0013D78AAC|nr:helix-turn-helix transcriptional regulator [Bacteroides sp. 519]NDV60735.1 LuxR family transcriptional regulator [Bacteroides sp. 519]